MSPEIFFFLTTASRSRTPVVERGFGAAIPTLLQGVFQHLVRSIHGHDFESFLQQHDGVDPETTLGVISSDRR